MKSFLIYPLITAILSTSVSFAGVTEQSFPVGAPGAAASNVFTVDLSSAKATLAVDKNFYGSQMDPYVSVAAAQTEPKAKLDAQYELLNSMNALLPSLNLGRVRVGGNLYENYDFKNNLTYMTKKGMGANFPFIPIYPEDFATFGHENDIKIMFQVNMLGAGPVDAGNDVYTLNPALATAQTAAEFVTNYNSDPATFIGDFSMGNEFEQWRDTNPDVIKKGKPSASADEYINKYISYAVAMRKAQKKISGNPNDIKLWGPETSGSYMDWNTGNMIDEGGKDCSWNPTIRGRVNCSYTYNGKTFTSFVPYFLFRLADYEKSTKNVDKFKLLDYLSFHYYPNFRTDVNKANSYITTANGQQDVDAMLAHTEVWDNASFVNTKDMSSYKDASPAIFTRMNKWLADYYPTAKVGVTEFAVDSSDETIGYHPIVRPLYLADSIGRAARSGVAYFSQAFLNVEAESNIPWALIRGNNITNLGEVYSLFSNNFQGQVLKVAQTSNPMVNAYAVQTAGGETNVMVVNKTRQEQSVGISVKLADGSAKTILANVAQPAWSVRLYNIKADGTEVIAKTFGASEMGVPVQ